MEHIADPRANRLSIPLFLLGLIGALLLGRLVPEYGVNILLALAGIGVAVLVLVRPILAFYCVLVTIPLENVFVFGGGVTWVRIVGMVAFGVWLLPKMARRESWATVLSAKLLTPALLFTLFALSSTFWAQYPSVTFDRVLTLVRLLALSLMVVDLTVSWQRMEWLIKLLILGGLIALVLTISQFLGYDFLVGPGTRSSIGPTVILRAGASVTGTVNETATILTVLLPFAFYLLRASTSRLWRLAGLLAIVLIPVAVLFSFSRASYLMLLPALGAQLWEMFKGDRGDRWRLLLIGLVVAIVLVATVPWEDVLARAATTSTFLDTFLGMEDDPNTLSESRLHLWRIAAAIFRDHPLLGSGYGNYSYQSLRYQFLVPGGARVFYTPRSPHSSILGLLADLGLVGIVLWIWLQAVVFRNLIGSWSASRGTHYRLQQAMVQATFYSFLVYTLYSIVTSTPADKSLWLLLGLSEVSQRLSQEHSEVAQ